MDDFDLPAPPTAIPARSEGGAPITATTDAPGFGDRFDAAWLKRTVETDMWEFAGRIGFELDREIMDALPAPAVDPRPMDALPQDQRPEDIEDVRARMFREGDTGGGNPETRFRAYLLQRAAEAGLTDVPLTIEDHKAEVDRRRMERYNQALDVLAIDGGGFAGFMGELSRDIADPVNLLLAPLGIGGGFVRTVASETLLGGVAAAASLPRENRVADELGFERPDWLMRIGTEAAASGVLGGVFYGLVKGGQALTRSGRQQTPEPRPGDPVPPVAPHVHRDALDEAGAAIEADRPEDLPAAMQTGPSRRAKRIPDNAPDFDFSAKGNASPRLNPVGYVFGKLLSRGLEPHIAAGLLGNLMQESGAGLNVRAVGDNGNSIGIGQWNGPRRKALLAYAKAKGEDWPSMDTQIDFLFFEISGPEARAWSIIRQQPDAASAARAASEHYWRPGIPHMDRRVRYALGVIEQWEGGNVPKGGATAQGFTPSTTQAGYTSAGQVRSAGGMRADIVYEVVDASTLVRASGDLQPRDRTQANSDEWIAKTAAELDPALLMPAPTLDRGAPIIGKDNIIESGNGRVAAVVRAAELHPDRIDAYRQQIEAAGFDIPADVKTPVLVGRRQNDFTPDERRKWVIDGQDSGVARMTPMEQARADATTINRDVLAKLVPGKLLSGPENVAFVRAALNRLPRSERNAFQTKGRLNVAGQEALRKALFARAFPDPDLVRSFAEEEARELKGLMDALEDASPAWAKLTADLEAGLIRPDFDITGHVLEAMRLIGRAREEAARDGAGLGNVLSELLDEVDLLQGALSPLTQALVRRFWKNGRAARSTDIGQVLTRYAIEARKVGAPEQTVGVPDVIDVLRKIDPDAFGDLTELGAVRGITDPPEPDVSAPRMDAEDLGDGAMSDAVEQADVLTAEQLRNSFDAAPASEVSDDLARAANDILADGDFDLDIDGVTMRASEVLDAIEADRQLDEVVQACRIGGPDNG